MMTFENLKMKKVSAFASSKKTKYVFTGDKFGHVHQWFIKNHSMFNIWGKVCKSSINSIYCPEVQV